VGRSSTIQLFHGSEVAFWPHADTHAAGILQAVADAPGTEIILESTANGVGNFFHQLWASAERGASDFIAVFVPWHWQEEYRRPPPEGFALWLEDVAGAAIPDDDALQADACAPSYSYDSNTRLAFEKKDDMRRRGVPNPDLWDAVALTFAEPVAANAGFNRDIVYPDLGIA
jgi:hypothetical protein